MGKITWRINGGNNMGNKWKKGSIMLKKINLFN